MKPFFIPLLAICISACNSSSELEPLNPTEPTMPGPLAVDTHFNDGVNGWQAGFSDYPVGDVDIFELVSEISLLPDDSGEQGFRLKGSNRSDDLFMFLKLKLTNLAVNTRYTLSGRISFLSNAGEGCVGIGGAPGESVYVKLGASETEPKQVDYYLNIDKGDQSQPGNDADTIGNVAVGGVNCSGEEFAEKTIMVSEADGFEFQSSDAGDIWVFLGTDSGFEGITDLYYKSLQLVLTPEA